MRAHALYRQKLTKIVCKTLNSTWEMLNWRIDGDQITTELHYSFDRHFQLILFDASRFLPKRGKRHNKAHL